MIDLETASAGPAEADIARVEVLHGPAFGDPLPAGWRARFVDGYGAPLDDAVLAFFRALHRLNLGYFAATCGWWEHVAALEAELEQEASSP